MDTTLVTADAVRHVLLDAIARSGSAREWGRQNHVSPHYISDVLTGRREPGAAILRALEYERVTLYQRIA